MGYEWWDRWDGYPILNHLKISQHSYPHFLARASRECPGGVARNEINISPWKSQSPWENPTIVPAQPSSSRLTWHIQSVHQSCFAQRGTAELHLGTKVPLPGPKKKREIDWWKGEQYHVYKVHINIICIIVCN